MIRTLAITALFTVFTTPAWAFGALSCSELDDAVDTLDDVDVALLFADDVDEETDEFLRFLTVSLLEAAEDEDDGKLKKHTERLRRAYNDEDLDEFQDALNDVSDRLEDIYDEDC